MIELFEKILISMQKKTDTVLVSVIETTGSTPRKAGAHMLAGPGGRIWGTIGGGPLEAAALEQCPLLLAERRSCTKELTLRDDVPLGLPAVCGGTARIHLHFIAWDDADIRSACELALRCLTARIQCRLIIDYGTSGGISVRGGGETLGAPVPESVLQSLPDGPAIAGTGFKSRFVQPLLREEKVFLFGGGHVTQALVPVLAGIGFRCIVVDDRPDFVEPSLFHDAEETHLLPLDGWQDALAISDRDFLCIMTRGHRKDLSCLELALNTPARYIGLMGSKRKIACTNEALRQKGFTEADIARISTPVGLPIGAQTPAEIAISIAAQMIMVRAGMGDKIHLYGRTLRTLDHFE